jgi:hypothetical protein
LAALLGVSLPVVPPVLPVVPPVLPLPVLPVPVLPPPVVPEPVLPEPVAPLPVLLPVLLPVPPVPVVLPEPLPVAVEEPPVGFELCPERSPLHDTASSDNEDKAMRLMERKLRICIYFLPSCFSLDHRRRQPPCRR